MLLSVTFVLIVPLADLVSTYAQNEQNFNAVERVRISRTSLHSERDNLYLGSALHGTTVRGRHHDAERPAGLVARAGQDRVQGRRPCLS